MSDPRAHRAWAAAALVAAILWLVSLPLQDILAFPDRLAVLPNLETDAAAYDEFARAFAATWRLDALPTKHPPGWIVLLATVYATVGHSYVAGKLVSWLALLVVVGLAAWLAYRLRGPAAAVIAALLCAGSPGLRGYVGTLQYEVLTAALFTLFLVLSTRVCEAGTHTIGRRAVLAGAAGAALVLTRETFVLVVPMAACWIWWRRRNDLPRRFALHAALVLVAVAAAPPLAWSALQTVHHQRLILISEKGPKEFELGNNPLANGTYNEPLVGMAEPAGFAFIRAHPADAIRLAGRKVLYMFGVLRDGWGVPHPAVVWIWRATTGALPLAAIAPVVRGGWLLAACVVALLMLGRRGAIGTWWVLPASVGALLVVHVITIGSYRFAIPLLPVLYVLASVPLAAVTRAVAPARISAPVAAACLLLVALTVAAQYRPWPLRAEYEAVDLDGLTAANVVDDVSGSRVRFAAGTQGARPVALLADTYMPRGPLTLSAGIRRTSGDTSAAAPILRVALVHLDGEVACARDVLAAELPDDRFTNVAVRCRLLRDGPATLAIYSLGTGDFAVDAVRLAWTTAEAPAGRG